MDELGINEEPKIESGKELKEQAGDSWRYARKTFSIVFDGKELYELAEILETVAKTFDHYPTIASAVVLREKIMCRWKKRQWRGVTVREREREKVGASDGE